MIELLGSAMKKYILGLDMHKSLIAKTIYQEGKNAFNNNQQRDVC